MKNKLKKKVLAVAAVSAMALGALSLGSSAGADGTYKHNHSKVKNVIFLIPDGFSASYATNYRWFKGKESQMDSILVGMHRTYSADTEVTDSAAAGTAMATGIKTNNGMISTSPDGKKLTTILEAAEASGKATGLVATSTITHATPAVFASHVASRADEASIAPQMVENGVDVLLGGGKKYFPDSLIDQAKKKSYTYINHKSGLASAAKSNKLIGLFADDALAPSLDREETNQPSLAEMTDAALNVLKKDKDGFFLMVEGSQIDWAGHDHDAAWAMNDVQAFEEALAKALAFAKKDKQTLVVVAGDHDTGGMSVGGYGVYDAKVEILRNITATGDYMVTKLDANRSNIKAVVKQYTSLDLTDTEVEKIKNASKPDMAINDIISERALVGWTSTAHTGVDVPLYAFGPGSDMFNGLHQNTDLPVLMAKAMKINLSGKK
ncbi:alkaline phosphatase [Neobacillus piezotolerans]|uniref:Alkaline phosphatase n=1 Tax=Neobacillus piezotolerans TaxID=2259171 RepID=A0A3D8GTE6_9BACI|nr:alkaline phosphatase [Neobacillus piezotolerans]RDU37740.1 alkaline phosphatase [Neobacillus piezotolerans]